MIRSNRRIFLRGLFGATLALPFLESALPKEVRAAPVEERRLVFFFCCNGVNMDRWWPNVGYGPIDSASFGDDRGLSPLAPWAHKLLIPRGMHMSPRGFGWDPSAGDDHMKLLAPIAETFLDAGQVERLRQASTAAEVQQLLGRVQA